MPLDELNGLEEAVFATLIEHSGRTVVGSDERIGAEIGIYGGDSIELFEELEEKFGLDLRPLIESSKIATPPTWWDRLLGRKQGRPITDFTVGQLVDYVREHATRSPASGAGQA